MTKRISIGGLVTALLGGRGRLLGITTANVVDNDDNTIAHWFADKLAGKPVESHPFGDEGPSMVITLRIQVPSRELKKLFNQLSPIQLQIHQNYLDDQDVEQAANIIKTNGKWGEWTPFD